MSRDALAMALQATETGCVSFSGFHDGNRDWKSFHLEQADRLLEALDKMGYRLAPEMTAQALAEALPIHRHDSDVYEADHRMCLASAEAILRNLKKMRTQTR